MMLKINGIVYKIDYDGFNLNNEVHTGLQISDSITTNLDSVDLVLETETRPEFDIYDLAEFDNKKWVVSLVTPDTLEDLTYRTNVTLAELAIVLEKYPLSPCAFTNVNDNLLDQVEKLLYKVEPVFQGQQPRFVLTERFKTFLNVREGKDFVYDERRTLREILDDMISGYGVRARVNDLNDGWSHIVIDYLDLNSNDEGVKTLNGVTSLSEYQSAAEYADEFDVSLVNAQSRDLNVAYSGWQTLKPTTIGIADTTNFKLVVDYPIEEIVGVRARYEASYRYKNNIDDPDFITESREINFDITDIFIEQEIFDTFTIPEQERHIPYQRGTTEIGVLDTYKPFLITFVKLREHIQTASKDIIESLLGTVYNLTVDSISNADLINSVLFRIEYTPIAQFDFKYKKERGRLNKGVTSIVNQTDRIVDIDKYGRTIRAIANLAGNKTRYVEAEVYNESDMLKPGDKIEENYTLLSRERKIFTDHVKVTYTFMQHYEANTGARLSRERRLYNIASENLIDRSILIKDTLLISTSNLQAHNTSMLNNDTFSNIVKYFTTSRENLIDLDVMRFRTNATGSDAFVLNFYPKAVGDLMIWQAKPLDNYSVGLSSSSRVIGGKDVNANPYVDEKGEATDAYIRFASRDENSSLSNAIAEGRNLPKVNNIYFSNFLSDEYTFRLFKDRLEAPKFTYQLSAGAVNENIIFGDRFMSFVSINPNRIIRDLYLWISTNETYSKRDNHYTKGSRLENNLLYDDVNKSIYFTGVDLSQVKSWAIGTQDSVLAIAINSNYENINRIYLGLSRD